MDSGCTLSLAIPLQSGVTVGVNLKRPKAVPLESSCCATAMDCAQVVDLPMTLHAGCLGCFYRASRDQGGAVHVEAQAVVQAPVALKELQITLPYLQPLQDRPGGLLTRQLWQSIAVFIRLPLMGN